MPCYALKLTFGVILALVCLGPGPGCNPALAQYDGPTPLEEEDAENEALIQALDELGLDPSSPELEGLDNGDLWRMIEEKTAEPTAMEGRASEQLP
jgi:hypothetical protein